MSAGGVGVVASEIVAGGVGVVAGGAVVFVAAFSLGAVVGIFIHKARLRRWISSNRPSSSGFSVDHPLPSGHGENAVPSHSTDSSRSVDRPLPSVLRLSFSKLLREAWDNNDRTESEKATAEDELKCLTSSLEVLRTGIVVCDSQGRVITRNSMAATFVAARHGKALVAEVLSDLLDLALSGITESHVLELSGHPRNTYEIKASPIENGGEILGAVALVFDITGEHRINTIRQDFVANVSHELKTPVGALSLLAESLSADLDREVFESLVERIRVESGRADEIIDGLLDLSYIEAGKRHLDELVDLSDAVTESMNHVAEAAEKRGVRLDFSDVGDALETGDIFGTDEAFRTGEASGTGEASDTGGVFDAASDRLKPEMSVLGSQVLLVSALVNLLENAIKFTDPGGLVEVRVKRSDSTVSVVVRDDGVGIPVADQSRIFERFYRVDRSRVFSKSGVGLGLSIVRHIVLNHGGEVTVKSQEGKGSTFTITLPTSSAREW